MELRFALRRLALRWTLLAFPILEIFHPRPSGVAESVEQGGLPRRRCQSAGLTEAA